MTRNGKHPNQTYAATHGVTCFFLESCHKSEVILGCEVSHSFLLQKIIRLFSGSVLNSLGGREAEMLLPVFWGSLGNVLAIPIPGSKGDGSSSEFS